MNMYKANFYFKSLVKFQMSMYKSNISMKFCFSSNIVLLVVLFSLKHNFVLFDFKTANLKLTWFQVRLVSYLLFCLLDLLLTKHVFFG